MNRRSFPICPFHLTFSKAEIHSGVIITPGARIPSKFIFISKSHTGWVNDVIFDVVLINLMKLMVTHRWIRINEASFSEIIEYHRMKSVYLIIWSKVEKCFQMAIHSLQCPNRIEWVHLPPKPWTDGVEHIKIGSDFFFYQPETIIRGV